MISKAITEARGNDMEAMPYKDASPLSTHPIYSGEDVDQIRDVLSHLFNEISFEPETGGTPFKAEVNGVELSKFSVAYLRFGSGYIAGPVEPLDFHTIQLTHSGSCVFDIDRASVPGNRQTGVLLSAGQKVRVHPACDNATLCLIVKDQVLRSVLSAWTGHTKIPPLRFVPRFDPKQRHTASFLSFFNTFVRELDRPGSILNAPAAIASFEHAMIMSLFFGFDHNFRDALYLSAAEAGPAQVRQVEEYLEAHASQPIDMQNLAKKTGHSVSSIYRAFRKHRDYAPMEFLRMIRLRLARQRLLQAGPGSSVTSIALECGFAHLGRFAIEYKRHFGESPSETLAARQN